MKKGKIIIVSIIFFIILGLFQFLINIDSNNLIIETEDPEIFNKEREIKNDQNKISLTQTTNSNRYSIKIRGGFFGKIKVKMITGVGINCGNWEVTTKSFFGDKQCTKSGEFIAGDGLSYTDNIDSSSFFGKITVKINIGHQSKSRSGIVFFGINLFFL